MSRNRPFGVTILAILAAIAAIIAIYHTLQMLHLLPIQGPFGAFSFFTFSLLGALLWGFLALIYIWVVRMLWNLDPRGWLFVAVIATLNLILAVISIFGQSSWQAMLPAILVNGLILIYCLLPGTKAAFGMSPGAGSGGTMVDVPTASEAAVETRATPMAAVVETEEVIAAPEPEEDSMVAEMAAAAVVTKGLSTDEAPDVEEEVAAEEMGAEAEAEELSTAKKMAVTAVAVDELSGDSAMGEVAEEVSIAEGMEATGEMVEEAEEATGAKMMVTGAASLTHDLSYVEGIGEVYSGKLKEVGVETPQDLLERGATPQGRKELAEETGISHQLILKWVGEVDLYRISGLGSEYSELLKAAGVDTVPELAQRNPTNLHAKLKEVNDEFKHVRHLPSKSQVEDWVEQAKDLPRVVSY